MTPAESVVMDWLLERGYTREQAARALVALRSPASDRYEDLNVLHRAANGALDLIARAVLT